MGEKPPSDDDFRGRIDTAVPVNEEMGTVGRDTEASPIPGEVFPLVDSLVLAKHSFPTITVNERHEVVYVTGQPGPYVLEAGVRPGDNLIKVVLDEVRPPLYALLDHARMEEGDVQHEVWLTQSCAAELLRLWVRPLAPHNGPRGHFLVIFQRLLGELDVFRDTGAELSAQLEHTREQLIAMVDRDVSEKVRVQNELEQRAAQQAAVSELGQYALKHRDLQVVFVRAAELVAGTLRVPFCTVLECVLPGRDELLLRTGLGCAPALVGVLRLPAAAGQAGYTLRERAPVVTENLAEDPRFKDQYLECKQMVVSGMSTVINGPDGGSWGVLSAHSDELRAFTQDDVNFLQAVANILASSIARVSVEEELRAAKQSAEEANAAKDRVMAMLSHELRTPLTPALTISSALAEDPRLPVDIRARLYKVSRNVELEARLIDDLLDLTRIREGKLALEPEPASALELLQHTIEICSADAGAKQIDIKLEMPAQDWVIYVDPPRTKQIFWNILKNAVKYTPRRGRIEVRCVGVHDSRLCIEFADTGIGMDKELLARAFEPFEQGRAEDGTQKRSSGLGLGLAIVRSLVEAHGGRVTAESPGPGQGSTFHVELPLAGNGIVETTLVDTSRPLLIRPASAMIRVLLVEDHDDSADALKFALEDLGMQVTVCNTGREAVSQVSQQGFDVVISDVGLPDMAGYELFAELRARQPELQGIAYSGYGQDSDVARCLEAGFRTHLTKPVPVSKLERAIHQILQILTH